MGVPKFLQFCYKHKQIGYKPRQGIEVKFIKSRRMIRLSGWYDTFVAMGGDEISLGGFLHGLGITLKDCERGLNEAEK